MEYRRDNWCMDEAPFRFVRNSGLYPSQIHSPVPRWQLKRRLYALAVTVLIVAILFVRFA